MTNWFEIRVRQSTEWQPQVAATFMQALTKHIKGWMDLEIVCTHGQIRFVVFSSDENNLTIEIMRSLVRAYYPDAEVLDPDGWRLAYPFSRRFHAFARSESHFYETLTSVHQHKRVDPLALAVQTMGQLEPGEVLTYHVHIWRLQRFSEAEVFDLLTISASEGGYRPQIHSYYRQDFFEALGTFVGAAIQNRRLKKERIWGQNEKDTQRYMGKLTQELAEVSVYLRFDTPKQERLGLLSSVAAAVKQTSNQELARLVDGVERSGTIKTDDDDNNLWPVLVLAKLLDAPAKSQSKQPERELIVLLTPDELASLWHLPHQGFTTPQVQWVAEPDQTALPDSLKGIQGTLLGMNGEDEVRLPHSERTSHLVAIGKTRVGKSSFLQTLASDAIAQGWGVGVVDPHGPLVQALLRSPALQKRLNDLILLDVDNQVNGISYPPPINPLAGDADVMAGTMLRVYPELKGTRMDRWLAIALKTLKYDQQPTIWDIQRVFEDDGYRAGLLKRANSLALRKVWENYEKTKPGERDISLNALFSRLDAFYTSDELLAITCNPTPLNIDRDVADGKIILISLSSMGGKIGESERAILGTALVSQIRSAAMSGQISEGRRPFMLYLDEAHFFRTAPLSQMLSETGKNGLGMVLADQYLGQLTEVTQDALEGNVGTIISFEVGGEDAAPLSVYTKPVFGKDDLTKLGKYRAAVSMRDSEGNRAPAFLLETLAPPNWNGEADVAREAQLRARSVEILGLKTYSEVQDWLATRQREIESSQIITVSNKHHETEPDDPFIQPTE